MSGTYNCQLAYAIQVANQPLLSMFVRTYNGEQGQEQWLNLPSNQRLLAQGREQEVQARWQFISIAWQNSIIPASSAICSTNLSNQLQIHDLLMAYLIPQAYSTETCEVATGSLTSSQESPITIAVTPAGGETTTVTYPQSQSLPQPIQDIQPLGQATTNSQSAVGAQIPQNMSGNAQIVTQDQLNQLLQSLGSGQANGFAGTQSNQQLLQGVMG